jgi:hypothetical protein
MIGGEIVYENGRFTRSDKDAMMNEIAVALNRPRSPQEERRRWMANAVFPYVKKFYDGYLENQSGLDGRPQSTSALRLALSKPPG